MCTNHKEANIVINGKALSAAQAMTVRVAMDSFVTDMGAPGALGADEHGWRMAAAYKARSVEVLKLIHASQRRSKGAV